MSCIYLSKPAQVCPTFSVFFSLLTLSELGNLQEDSAWKFPAVRQHSDPDTHLLEFSAQQQKLYKDNSMEKTCKNLDMAFIFLDYWRFT